MQATEENKYRESLLNTASCHHKSNATKSSTRIVIKKMVDVDNVEHEKDCIYNRVAIVHEFHAHSQKFTVLH